MNTAVNKRNKNRPSAATHSNASNVNSKPQSRQNKSANERTISAEGVYSNGRVMHVTTSLVGCLVEVEIKDGTKYEGVLKTFSPDFELVVDYAAKVEPNSTQNASNFMSSIGNLLTSLQAKNAVKPTHIFKFSDVVKVSATNVDLDFATAKAQSGMLTDTEISKYDNRATASCDKVLVPWDGGDCDGEELEDHSIAEGNTQNGWTCEQLFEYNERKFNVKSTYDPSLTGYTVPLVKGEGEEYEQRQARAEKIANEIEGNAACTERYAKEDADDEERYSAVSRPTNDSSQHNRHGNRRKPNTQSNYNASSGAPSNRGRSAQQNTSVPSPSPPFHTSKPSNASNSSNTSYNKQYSNNNSSQTSMPSYQSHRQIQSHQVYREEPPETVKQQYAAVASFGIQGYSKPEADETPPSTPHTPHSHQTVPTNQHQHPLPQRSNENRRNVNTNKRKEEVAADLKKFSTDFKLPSNTDNKENIKSSDSHTKNSNNNNNNVSAKTKSPNEAQVSSDKSDVNSNDREIVENKATTDSPSPLSPTSAVESELAKKSTLNPNAKTFTPRSPLAPVSASSTPPSVASTPSSTVSSVAPLAPQMAPQHHHHQQHQQQHPQQTRFQSPLMQLQAQYIPQMPLTLGPNQYLMTNVAVAPTFAQQNPNQQNRSFRNKGPQQFANHNVRHEFAQPSHVSVSTVTGHPVLATAPIASPQQMPVNYATQQTTGMVTPQGPPQQMYAFGYHNRMTMIPTQAAMGMMQQTVHYDPQLQQLYAPGGVQLQQLVSQAHHHVSSSGGHSSASHTPQSGTPTTPLHGGAPTPSPVHHQPNQPPTPTPQQAVMYANVASPHNPSATVPHSSSGAYHHQLVIIPSQAVPGAHHSSAHGGIHPHALSHNTPPGNHHGGPPHTLMPVQIIPSGAAPFNHNPGKDFLTERSQHSMAKLNFFL